MIAGALALLCVSCSSTPALAAELYTPDGFAKQIDTYKDLALSASNAIRNKSWDDNVSVASSVGSVENTVNFGGAGFQILFQSTDSSKSEVYKTFQFTDLSSSYARFKMTDVVKSVGLDDSYYVAGYSIMLYPRNLPPSGNYTFSYDVSSQFSYQCDAAYIGSYKNTTNAEQLYNKINLSYKFSGGDVFVSPVTIGLTNVVRFDVWTLIPSNYLRNIDLTFHVNFKPTSSSPSSGHTTAGTDTSSQDTQNSIANTTTQIASSVNEVYESIQQLMQHISNQLAALWDQIYNYCHVPTYNKLQEILLSIQNISMGSDLQKIADQISNSTTEQTNDLISNANSNQEKTDQAIQKHGNFIIEGLKSLFIPSDEYFKSWFDGMYSFFHDRLGFLMLPIDILIKFVNMFQSAGGGFSGVPFPEFKWIDGTVIIPSQTVQFDFLATEWGKDIQTKLYFVGDVIMIGALLVLMHRKMEEVLRS